MKLRLDGEEGEDGDIAKAQVVRMTMALPPHLLRSRRSLSAIAENRGLNPWTQNSVL